MTVDKKEVYIDTYTISGSLSALIYYAIPPEIRVGYCIIWTCIFITLPFIIEVIDHNEWCKRRRTMQMMINDEERYRRAMLVEKYERLKHILDTNFEIEPEKGDEPVKIDKNAKKHQYVDEM